jgi:hypothetical protein
MGKAKTTGSSEAVKSYETKVFVLTEQEYNMLKVMNISLQYNTVGQKIISGFIYYICNTKYGYGEHLNLQFEVDFDKDDRELKVSVIPTEDVK